MNMLALIVAASASAAIPLKSNAGEGTVNFLAVGRPSMLKIKGEAKGPEAKLNLDGEKLSGAISFSLEKLDTGIALRNEHMKEKYLEVKTHPTATLTLTDVAVDPAFGLSLTNGSEKPFRGKLALHGKEQEVNGTYTASAGNIIATFPLKLSDFAIDIPSYLGVKVAEDVAVSVELPLRKE